MDEKLLIARVLAGDETAERAFYDAHVDRVYRLAYRLTGDPDLAEEYTQQTFVRAFSRLPGFRGEAALSSWLHAITVTVTLSGLRKVTRRRRHETVLEALPRTAESRSVPDPDLRRRLAAAIDGLSDRLRVVFVMYCAEGYSHREIAAALDIPEGTSKARLSRARELLRAELGPETPRPAQAVGPALSSETES